MADVRIQVATRTAAQLAVDHVVNTVYFRDINLDPTNGTDYENLAVSVRDVFRAQPFLPVGYGCEATAYDLDDPKPRPIKAYAPWLLKSSGGGGAAVGVREVALCLSYFSERNLPRSRGRIFIGPWNAAVLTERPAATLIDALVALATGLANVGGTDVDWSLYSPTDGGLKKITNYWIDDEWDTQRSRGLVGTSRRSGATGE